MQDSLFPESLRHRLFSSGVMACLTIDDPVDAVPTARALADGGIDVMELTLRTPTALDSLRRIVAEVPEMLAGVGTILEPSQLRSIIEAGAAFGVAPGLSERVLREAVERTFPFAPGIATPTELEKALEFGCREMKLFPVEPIGGLSYMKSIWTPYAHLGVRFLPLGGVNIQNLTSYLDEPSVLAVGGSWIATPERIRSQNWSAITTAARAAVAIIHAVRKRPVRAAV